MTSEGETLVGTFESLGAIGPLRRRWLSTVRPLIARAQDELATDERWLSVGVGENQQSVLEGVVLTDRRIAVISQTEVRWFAREDVWEVSSMATNTVRGEVLSVYGKDWDLAWTQMKPFGAAPAMGASLRDGLSRRKQVGGDAGL